MDEGTKVFSVLVQGMFPTLFFHCPPTFFTQQVLPVLRLSFFFFFGICCMGSYDLDFHLLVHSVCGMWGKHCVESLKLSL